MSGALKGHLSLRHVISLITKILSESFDFELSYSLVWNAKSGLPWNRFVIRIAMLNLPVIKSIREDIFSLFSFSKYLFSAAILSM